MTRKDYVLIAEAINRSLKACRNDPEQIEGIKRATGFLAIALKRENNGFKFATFFEACGMDPNMTENLTIT